MKLSPILVFIISHSAAAAAVATIVLVVPVLLSIGAIITMEDQGAPLLIPAIALVFLGVGVGLSVLFFSYTALFQFLSYKYKLSIIFPVLLSPVVVSLGVWLANMAFAENIGDFTMLIWVSCFGLYLLYWGISWLGSMALVKLAQLIVSE